MSADASGSSSASLRSIGPGRPVLWLVVQAFALAYLGINGTAVAGPYFPQGALVWYTLLFLIPLAVDPDANRFKKTLAQYSLLEYGAKFMLGFVATLAAFWLIFLYWLGFQPPRVPYEQAWALVAFQVAVVAPIEEFFFRGWVVWRLNEQGHGKFRIYGTVTAGTLVGSAIFSSYHLAAYGTAVESFVITGMIAVVWTWMSQTDFGGRLPHKLGIAASAGSHAAWNLCLLGVLTGGIFRALGM